MIIWINALIVPMSLIRAPYRTEILGGLADAGEDVLHVFLEVDAGLPLPASRTGPSCCARTGTPQPSWPTRCCLA